jgi:hypothetical protein
MKIQKRKGVKEKKTIVGLNGFFLDFPKECSNYRNDRNYHYIY